MRRKVACPWFGRTILFGRTSSRSEGPQQTHHQCHQPHADIGFVWSRPCDGLAPFGTAKCFQYSDGRSMQSAVFRSNLARSRVSQVSNVSIAKLTFGDNSHVPLARMMRAQIGCTRLNLSWIRRWPHGRNQTYGPAQVIVPLSAILDSLVFTFHGGRVVKAGTSRHPKKDTCQRYFLIGAWCYGRSWHAAHGVDPVCHRVGIERDHRSAQLGGTVWCPWASRATLVLQVLSPARRPVSPRRLKRLVRSDT